MRRITYRDYNPRASYLVVSGKPLTASANGPFPGGVITGALTATTQTDFVRCLHAKELAININVTAVSGTSPTLTIQFLVFDPIEGLTLVTLTVNSANIAAATKVRIVIVNGAMTVWINNVATSLGAMVVPHAWGLNFQIGGTTPSYSIDATYESRR